MKKAFTLIELLIVIAILGILAVGLLIALDPIEQTRRASDTTIVQSAGEIKNAVARYYASKLYYPWCLSTSTPGNCTYAGGGCTADTTAGNIANFNIGTGSCANTVVMTNLTTTGELKTNPPANIANALWLITTTAGTAYEISFIPASKAQKGNYAPAVGQPGVYTTNLCTAAGTAAACPLTSLTCAYCVF